jgi:hypothetical protein
MTKEGKQIDRGAWAIGGTTMIGLGIGFIFLQTNIFIFLASLLSGIGLGLVIAALLPSRRT